MAKKIVRGITDVKTINNQDFDTNNVNDLLSDGQYNYIHRKKGENEEYHNLTDNIKTISSDNTDLLTVTNNNKTTNTALLSPKHDKQKEQVLESTRDTITIHHGTNGTAEKTTVDTNPQKVLEHENLLTINGISKTTTENVTTIGLKTIDNYSGDLNELTDTCIVKPTDGAGNLPARHEGIVTEGGGTLTVVKIGDTVSQKYDSPLDGVYTRFGKYFEGEWRWIPWTGGIASTTSTIKYFSSTNFKAFIHDVTCSDGKLRTFSFECYNAAETVLTGELKQYLAPYVKPNASISNPSISNGAISITNDGTTMKLINSAPSENVTQHATFTFDNRFNPK